MATINWHPTPGELRRWALLIAPALGLAGALFHFVDWGIFAGGRGFAKFLWSFGAFAFLTGITGTKLGLPAYWLWTGFVHVVGSVITFVALAVVFFGVVTPLGLAARLFGRDRLQLRPSVAQSCWSPLDGTRAHDPERQF